MDADDASTGQPGHDTITPQSGDTTQGDITLADMDNEQLQAELARLEQLRQRNENIARIQYLRQGGTLSAEQLRIQEAAKSRGSPPDSGGGTKRSAADDLSGHHAKAFKADPPKHFSGDNYTALTEFIMGADIYFDAQNLDMSDPEVEKRAIRTTATWLDGDARQDYYRLNQAPEKWDDFLAFLKNTIKDP